MPLPAAPAFSVRAATGVLGAALAAGASVFAMRLPSTATRNVHIHRIQAQFGATVAFTAGSQMLFQAVRFGTATPTGGTAYTAVSHNSSATSDVTDIRASTTAALTVTSVVFETGLLPLLGTASPVVSSLHQGLALDLRADPIVLQPGEGLAIQNTVVWPVAGTGALTAVVSWTEG